MSTNGGYLQNIQTRAWFTSNNIQFQNQKVNELDGIKWWNWMALSSGGGCGGGGGVGGGWVGVEGCCEHLSIK